MIIKRKELLTLLKKNNAADEIKSGPTAYFFVSKKKDKNGMSIAKTINISMWKSFVIAKYKKIPIHIYSLKELKN